MKQPSFRPALLIGLAMLTACGGGSGAGPDATPGDAGPADASDGSPADGATPDGSRPDGSRPDAGPTPPTACDYADPSGSVFFVATDGDDDSGDGSSGAPWATIGQALRMVPDGSTVLVRAGTYTGRVRLRGTFPTGVVVRSEEMYRARLRNDDTVVTAYTTPDGCDGITLEGFDIAHSGPGAGALVVHVDGDGSNAVRRITLRNNVLHDSYDNDILKINNGISEVVVERNVFFNQTGSDEHIDINSAEGVIVQDNLFFNDFAASGRTNANDTSSFIVVKDSGGASDVYTGSQNIVLRRNIFLNYEGSSGTVFLLLGEDGQPFHETQNTLVENNLFLGNAPNPMRAALGVKGGRDVLFRGNTIVGDLPARAFAMRINREGDNPVNDGMRFFNNIWSDPTGTMGALDSSDGDDFSDTSPDHVGAFELTNNLYWNGGDAVPDDGAERINVSDDSAAVVADPALGDQGDLVVPHWDGSAFADGSSNSCAAFERLVQRYGTPAAGSAAIDAADASEAPSDDILGRPRGGSPDIGAVETP